MKRYPMHRRSLRRQLAGDPNSLEPARSIIANTHKAVCRTTVSTGRIFTCVVKRRSFFPGQSPHCSCAVRAIRRPLVFFSPLSSFKALSVLRTAATCGLGQACPFASPVILKTHCIWSDHLQGVRCFIVFSSCSFLVPIATLGTMAAL